MHGKVYNFNHKEGENIEIDVSFGGLLMRLSGDQRYVSQRDTVGEGARRELGGNGSGKGAVRFGTVGSGQFRSGQVESSRVESLAHKIPTRP